MPNAMLTESEKAPALPLYRLSYKGQYIQFFYDYDRAQRYIENSPLDSNDYEITEGY